MFLTRPFVSFGAIPKEKNKKKKLIFDPIQKTTHI
ncbi:MAG: hypothetical protein RL023_941, partial [Candidatus Parcubacteria bacterium]